ncbi:MAG: zinc-dependent metalloprotease [Actinomycetota bacterium]
MDAANTLDWSMGSYAARLADWDTAVDIGRRVSGPGVPVPGVERARLREDMAEIVPRAEGLIRGFTDMDVQGFRSRAWVMARSEWIRANLNGLQRLLEPLAERMLDGRPSRAELKRKALGAQTGALMGYVARKVLGQYDVFLPPDDEGLLYFVGPNIVEAERRYSLPPKDFRLWIAIHEVTHRVQFGSAAWLRGYLSGQVDDYLGSIQLDAGQLMNQLRRAAEEVRSGLDRRGMGGVFLLLSPEQREMFMRMQALMSLLEGHASYVMNEVARDHVKDVDRMRRALSARRRASNLERTLQKAIGFEQKIRQYDTGERFVRTIVDRAGMSTFNLVWRSAGDLPTLDEIGEPERWLVRVGG